MSNIIDFTRAVELRTVRQAREQMNKPAMRLPKLTAAQRKANAAQQAFALRERSL